MPCLLLLPQLSLLSHSSAPSSPCPLSSLLQRLPVCWSYALANATRYSSQICTRRFCTLVESTVAACLPACLPCCGMRWPTDLPSTALFAKQLRSRPSGRRVDADAGSVALVPLAHRVAGTRLAENALDAVQTAVQVLHRRAKGEAHKRLARGVDDVAPVCRAVCRGGGLDKSRIIG